MFGIPLEERVETVRLGEEVLGPGDTPCLTGIPVEGSRERSPSSGVLS